MGAKSMKPPMTVADLRRRLGEPSARLDESEVAVVRMTMAGGAGATPTVAIVGVHVGFDWDDGVLFLETEFPVAAAGAEFERERERTRKLSEAMGWILYVIAGAGTPEAKLVEIGKLARGHGVPADGPQSPGPDMTWFDRDSASYVARSQGAAYRAGMSSAAAICDGMAKEVEQGGTVNRRIKRAAAEVASALRACGDRIWDCRAKIDPTCK